MHINIHTMYLHFIQKIKYVSEQFAYVVRDYILQSSKFGIDYNNNNYYLKLASKNIIR